MQTRFPSIMTSSLIQWVSRFMYASGNGKKVYKILCLFLSDILYVYGQLIVALLFASAVLVPSGKETFHARLCFLLSCFLRFL